MKKINVEYGIDGRIIAISDNAVHFEQENFALDIEAKIPAGSKSVRGYIKAANGNSDVKNVSANEEGLYLLTIEDTYMSKGTLYVGFEAYDDSGLAERFEPLKVFVDGFVTLSGGSSDNVYAVTVEVAETLTLQEDEEAFVENIGTKKDVKLVIGIPQGKKGADGQTPKKGLDYFTPYEAEVFANEVEQKYVDALNNKVDKEEGKSLSTNDFDDNYAETVRKLWDRATQPYSKDAFLAHDNFTAINQSNGFSNSSSIWEKGGGYFASKYYFLSTLNIIY